MVPRNPLASGRQLYVALVAIPLAVSAAVTAGADASTWADRPTNDANTRRGFTISQPDYARRSTTSKRHCRRIRTIHSRSTTCSAVIFMSYRIGALDTEAYASDNF